MELEGDRQKARRITTGIKSRGQLFAPARPRSSPDGYTAAALLPFLSAKLEVVLPFLNPQIADELWVITSICSILASFFGYNLASRKRAAKVAHRTAVTGFVIALLSLAAIFVLVFGQALADFPRIEDNVARLSFVTLFIGLGISAGWGASVLLPLNANKKEAVQPASAGA